MPPHTRHRWLDRFGAAGSLVCAVHCALLPLAIAVLPSLGLSAWLSEGFEAGFVLFASLLGLFSLAWGYRRHRAVRALGLLLPGLAILWVGVLYPPLHQSVLPHAVAMTIGGTLVGVGHLVNLRLNHGHVHDASCAH
ncbi:MAG: MerC domain-containing protein [Proteobacteria bacterium]|nr:MerC domain-containing protein [Pseudomonadota bacterium]